MFSIHWFAITLHCDFTATKKIWARFFGSALGELTDKGNGARRYKQIAEGLLGSKIYYDYSNATDDKQHCHVEIPGSACEAVLPSVFPELISFLAGNAVRFSIKRADFAFDGVPFTPEQFLQALKSDNLISPIKRDPSLGNDSIRLVQSPCALRANGEIGTTTVYAGSPSSARKARVYDKRGDVRLEFELRDERAHAVCLEVFALDWAEWENAVKAHLRQFMDFKKTDFWAVFIASSHRAELKISSARRMSLSKTRNWVERQLSVSLSVLVDVMGKAELEGIIDKARKTRDRSRYASVLQLADGMRGFAFPVP